MDLQEFFIRIVMGSPVLPISVNAYPRENPMLKRIWTWLKQHGAWICRILYFASAFIGMYCYSRSSTFSSLFKELNNWWKILIYIVIGLLILFLMILGMIWQSLNNALLKAHLSFVVLMVTTLYTFFMDKAMEDQKIDMYSWISYVAFAIMWFSLSRLTQYGVEIDLQNFFSGILTIQIMKINPWFFLIGASISYCLVILRPILDAQGQAQPIMSLFIDSIEALETEKTNLINQVSQHVAIYLHNNDAQPDFNMVRDMLVSSNSFSNLHRSVKFLVSSGGRYEKTCCNEYIRWRREFLEECLLTCKLQELHDPEIWIKACNVAVKILFPNERTLCYRVFQGCSSSIVDNSYNEVCKDLIDRLLNIVETFASGGNVQNIVDCIHTLNNLSPEFQSLFSDWYSKSLSHELSRVGKKLKEEIKANLMGLEKLICFDMANSAVTEKGEIHPITLEVMNFLHFFNKKPLLSIFDSTIKMLERKLEAKSKSYTDRALGYVFMMNNLSYIGHEAKKSGMGTILGDDWSQRNRTKVRHNVELYHSSWNTILNILVLENNEEPMINNADNTNSIVDQFDLFNQKFKELCIIQSKWFAFDEELKEEMKRYVKSILFEYKNVVGDQAKYEMYNLQHQLDHLFLGLQTKQQVIGQKRKAMELFYLYGKEN